MNNPFNPEATAHYVLWEAIHKCGSDAHPDKDPTYAAYAWLEDTPRTSIVNDLAFALAALGYRIMKQ